MANLVFGAESGTTVENSFIFKLDRNNKAETKVFCFSDSKGFPTIADNNGSEFTMNKESYRMKVVVEKGRCEVYVDDVLAASAELPDYYADGYLGIGAAEGSTVTFQNTVYTPVDDGSDPDDRPDTPDDNPVAPETGDAVLPLLIGIFFAAAIPVFCIKRRKTVE